MSVGNRRDLEGLKEAGRVVRACLRAMRAAVRPGVSTRELNAIGAAVMRREKARSAPMAVYGFPAEVCLSVNDEIVHGVPSGRALRDGDLLKMDVTVEKNGYVADAALTVGVGTLTTGRADLVEGTHRALYAALSVARAGAPIHAIGRAVEDEARRRGLTVVRDLTGHGTGRTIHEEPSVPNHYDPAAGALLTRGLVIAIEPLLSRGSGECRTAQDGWTVVTCDGSPAAHFEHTIVVTEDDPILLTAAA